MNNNYKVYMYTNKVDQRRYVGVTRQSMEKRAHRGQSYRGSPYFYSAILKYGWELFQPEILADNLTKEQAAMQEREFITKFKTMHSEYGYNLHRGGFENCSADVFNRPGRVARIRATLKKQRSTIEARALMSYRMQKVWADPVRYAFMMSSRVGKPSGRKAVPVRCIETGDEFANLQLAAVRFGINKTCIWAAIHKPRRCPGLTRVNVPEFTHVHFELIQTNVDVKESELLGSPATVRRGDQQLTFDFAL